MSAVAIPKIDSHGNVDLQKFVPEELRRLGDLQSAIPEVAKNEAFLTLIARAVKEIPTKHVLVHGDARTMSKEKVGKAHLVLTSPPYWTLKKYRDSSGQLGHIVDYDDFIAQLDRVWQRCFDSLVVGGRLVCVVGDVCLSRRKNEGRHTVVPLHATIQEHCRKIGFDNLSPIIWHKIANAAYEVENGGGGFLGKPYEPNAVIKNDVEFILMQRKPGGYRTPQDSARILSERYLSEGLSEMVSTDMAWSDGSVNERPPRSVSCGIGRASHSNVQLCRRYGVGPFHGNGYDCSRCFEVGEE